MSARRDAGQRLRILVTNWQDRLNPQAGGAEIHLHEVFGRLAARGHQITLLASSFAGAEPETVLDGIRVLRTGGRHTFSVAAIRYYSEHLRNQRFDLLVEDLNKVPLFAPFWAREPVALLVHHLFGTTAFEEASLPLAAATWLLEKPLPAVYADQPVLAVSESTREDLVARGFRKAQIRVVENGVDLVFYAPDPGLPRFENPTVLYMGRLKKYKRVDLVIRAFAVVRERVPGARLVVAGTGDAAPELAELVRQLGVADAVEMPGFVSEERKRELFRRSWLHTLTSGKEGWGISNIEAAACGTATLASNSPGLRDSVRDGETGFLVPHGDVDALARRMKEVLQDPRLRDELGRNARAFAAHFSWDRAADGVERFLVDAVGSKGAAANRRRQA